MWLLWFSQDKLCSFTLVMMYETIPASYSNCILLWTKWNSKYLKVYLLVCPEHSKENLMFPAKSALQTNSSFMPLFYLLSTPGHKPSPLRFPLTFLESRKHSERSIQSLQQSKIIAFMLSTSMVSLVWVGRLHKEVVMLPATRNSRSLEEYQK